MTAKQAYLIVKTKNPVVNVIACYEYDSVFAFHLMPHMLRLSKNPSRMLDGAVSVNKVTGEVTDFKPFRLPLDEYRRGKKLPESSYKE